MTHAETLRQKAVRFHLIADTILRPDASTDLHEVAAILEQHAKGLEDRSHLALDGKGPDKGAAKA